MSAEEHSFEVRNANLSATNEKYHSLPNLQVQQGESGVCMHAHVFHITTMSRSANKHSPWPDSASV